MATRDMPTRRTSKHDDAMPTDEPPRPVYYRLSLRRTQAAPGSTQRHLSAAEVAAVLPAVLPTVTLSQYLAISFCDCPICTAARTPPAPRR
jgi:hypothetical protein